MSDLLYLALTTNEGGGPDNDNDLGFGEGLPAEFDILGPFSAVSVQGDHIWVCEPEGLEPYPLAMQLGAQWFIRDRQGRWDHLTVALMPDIREEMRKDASP